MNLYWVTTEDNLKDWFVVANNKEEAITFQAVMQWFNHDLVNAEIVLEIPKTMYMNVGWPSMEELVSFGAKILCNEFSRVVEINGKRFCERILS